MISKPPFNMLIYSNPLYHPGYHFDYPYPQKVAEFAPDIKMESDYSCDQSSSNSSNSTRYLPSPFYYNLINGPIEGHNQLTLSNDLLFKDKRKGADIYSGCNQLNRPGGFEEFDVEPLHLMWFSTNEPSDFLKSEAPVKVEKQAKKKVKDTDILSEESRSSKGLRILSLKVKDIVCEKKQSTYKEIAECLISTLEMKKEKSENSLIDFKGAAKDEQNIKRRVYDALNVLISAGILKKRGKIVYSDSFSSLQGEKVFKKKLEEKLTLKQKIAEKRCSIKEKTEKLKNLREKYSALNNLIARNMNDSKAKTIKSDEFSKIRFPFIILELKRKADTTIEYSKKRDFMKIVSKNPFKITGDIDSLLKLKMNEAWESAKVIGKGAEEAI